ncbi:YadA C-terminal domain-containing protein [Streptobacillus ratti]|uniref:YadA C-terminal domain-containing protein n=1 Tax=Streptobacillus ratti TaxID=1720557 RepID=UPI000934C74F|nr:YadA C-terminal domain-containing protein [Streptobacillus ratti]
MKNIETENKMKSKINKRLIILFLILGESILWGADSPKAISLVNNGSTESVTPTKDVTIGGLKYGDFAGSTSKDVASIGKSGEERQLQNVSAGQIDKNSTNAVNGSQLYATNNVLSNVVSSIKGIFGGNADITKEGDETGKLTMSNIGGTGKSTIDDAIKASKTEIKSETTSAISVIPKDGTNGNKEYTLDVKTDGKTIVKDSDGKLKVNVGTITTEIQNGNKILKADDETKVATTGEVAKAINGLANNTISFGGDSGSTSPQSLNKSGGLNFKIKGSKYITTKANGSEVLLDLTDKVKNDIAKGVIANSGVANAVAMSNLPQISGKGHNVSGSYGYFNGEHAFAIGLSGTNEIGNLIYRASGSLNTRGHVALGAGLGYQFDSMVSRNKEILKLQRNGNINLLDEKVYELELQFNGIEKENILLKEELKNLKYTFFNEIEKENVELKNKVKDLNAKLSELEILIKNSLNMN